jgi:hypothetical protein
VRRKAVNNSQGSDGALEAMAQKIKTIRPEGDVKQIIFFQASKFAGF